MINDNINKFIHDIVNKKIELDYEKQELDLLGKLNTELIMRITYCKKYLESIDDHDFSCIIPNSILNGDYEIIKNYYKHKKLIYNEAQCGYDEELKCLENIISDLKSKGDK